MAGMKAYLDDVQNALYNTFVDSTVAGDVELAAEAFQFSGMDPEVVAGFVERYRSAA